MKNKGFVSLIGLVLTLVIILILFFMVMNAYVKKPVPVAGKEEEKFLSEQGINTSSQKAVLDSARKTLKDIDEDAKKRLEGEGF